MKRVLISGVLLIVLVIMGITLFTKLLLQKPQSGRKLDASATRQTTDGKNSRLQASKTIFVPYWQLTADGQLSDVRYQNYDRHIYFGIAGNSDGIDKTDPGYQNLARFAGSTPGSKWLAVRMIDGDINDEVLQSKESQTGIVREAVAVAKQYGFEGIVLDFEYNSLFGGQIDQISDFYRQFREETRKENLRFGATIYGDVFYRKRPYDLAKISQYCDEIFIMAYDFHKSRGEPGPNFPLHSGKKYSYSYDELLGDLGKVMPLDKVTFIFGMYGYDWKVDEQKRPITQAKSLTSAQIQKEFVDNCDALHCVVLKDPVSGETEVDYIDGDTRYHIIWYESSESSAKKREVFKRKRN